MAKHTILLSEKHNIEYKRFIASLFPATAFILIIWLVRLVETENSYDLFYLGIYPRKFTGLVGVILAPLIHGNFNHLINNSIPLFFMVTAVFYFYHTVSWRVFFYSYLITGLAVWFIARPSYHIGASGLIYSFGSFLFFSGIFRENINLLAISLLVSFMYGSMVWGIFPYQPEMSWESHLSGMVVGFMLAYYFRHQGPGPTRRIEDMEEEEEEEDSEQLTVNSEQ